MLYGFIMKIFQKALRLRLLALSVGKFGKIGFKCLNIFVSTVKKKSKIRITKIPKLKIIQNKWLYSTIIQGCLGMRW
jgi:hypothetical protein